MRTMLIAVGGNSLIRAGETGRLPNSESMRAARPPQSCNWSAPVIDWW